MKITRIVALIGLFVTSLFVFNSCKKDKEENEGTARFNVFLTDSPAYYQEVNVEIINIEVHSNNTNGWVSLNTNSGIYNLLSLTNGIDTLLASKDIPVGIVSQIRFVLGTNNSIKVNGTTYPLQAPSADYSGLKIGVHYELVAGITYNIKLDFNVAKSIVEHGNGTYSLKPVIKAITTATSGAIKGVITPVASHPAIYAILGTDTSSTFPDSLTGNFLVQGLPAGSYKLLFDPRSPYADTTFNNVVVTIGVVTDMDTVTIH